MSSRRSIRPIGLTILLAAVIIAIGLAIGLGVGLQKKQELNNGGAEHQKKDEFKSAHGSYRYAAAAADNKLCSEIGADIMARHRGNAADSAVATLLCIGAMSPHSGGIGGGSFAVLYDRKTNGWHAFDFRETAPAGATTKMFYKKDDRKKSVLGGLAIAVPGEVKGAIDIHKHFGTLPWRTLVMPTVKLLRDGLPLPIATKKALSSVEKYMNVTSVSELGFGMFVDANNKIKPAGSIIKMPKLAKTFQTIADDPNSFYDGALAKDIVKDIQEEGGIITTDDLKKYKTLIKEPSKLDLPNNMTIYSMPAPGSGPVLNYILSILSGYNMDASSLKNDESKILAYHRIVEAMKFAYAKRSMLGDEDFVNIKDLVKKLNSRKFGEETRQLITDDKTHDVPYYKPSFYSVDDKGTSHLSVMDVEGNAVSITSTVNHYFGSKVVGSRTGIIFNNEMDDFSTPNVSNSFHLPPSESNFIQPGKRPMSSMCPAIVFDNLNDRVSLVTGAAGGSMITSGTALDIINTLWFNMSTPESLDAPRFHHQLIPNEIIARLDLPQIIKQGLEAKGHKFRMHDRYLSVIHTIKNVGDHLEAACDYRKGGEPAGF